jgi:zinc protease
VQREDVQAYYREKYVPNNLFFVVVGAIQASSVESQIRQAFAQAKARPIPATALLEEPRQMAPREVVEEAAVELAYFHFSWHIPDIRHPDVPILDVLATLLGAGRSSRLYQQVREKAGLVQSVDAWTYNPGNPGLLGMSAVAEPVKFDDARAAMLAEVDRMKTDPVSSDELTKAVKQFISATLAARKTMQGQAQDLGSCWMAAGDLNFSERYLAAVKLISPADLQRIAREYLTTENMTIYALLPTGTAPKPVEMAVRLVDHPIQKFELSNGLRLLVKEDHRLPFVQFRAVFLGGVLAETPQNSGLTLLLAKMLLKGTPTRPAEQIAYQIESVGGSIDSYGGYNSFGVNAEVLSSDFELGLDMVADVILNPIMPLPALELERQMQLASIKAQRDQLLLSATRLMRRALFGEGGYGLDINGIESSVSQIQAADLKAFHEKMTVPNSAVLAIFGDVNSETVHQAVAKALGPWERGASFDPSHQCQLPEGIQRVVETRDKNQAVLVLGFPGITLHDPDRYTLELIQEACSDMGSRLFLRIREKLGLAYYVGAQNFIGLAPGYFAFYAGTTAEKANLVEKEILEEAAQLCKEGLTPAELKRARAKLIGQKKIARQDLGTYAMTTVLDELYGLGYSNSDTEDVKYEAVTVEQSRDIARKYLTTNRLVIAIIKPE